MSTPLDFFQSNESQKSLQSTFQDKRFNKNIQFLKFAPDAKGQRIDILPVSDTKTHAIIREHRIVGSVMLCPQMFNTPCPLCDAMAMNRNDGWFWQNFKTRDRALFNAIPISKEGKVMTMAEGHTVPIYLYEVGAPQKKARGFWLMLTGALGSTDTEDAFKKQFFSWDNGSTLKMTFRPEKFEGKEYAEVSNLEFIHPRHNYGAERAKWEPHLYKVPDIYQEPDVDAMARYLEMMLKQRSGGGGATYNSDVAPNTSAGFYAGNQQQQQHAVGTAAWVAANADADEAF